MTVVSIVITTVVVVLTVVSLATQMGPIVAAASVGAGQAIASDPQVLAWLQPLVSSSSDFLAAGCPGGPRRFRRAGGRHASSASC